MSKNKTEIFISKSKKIHGDKYDYSKVDYINNVTPVLIGYGGVYHEVTPQNHLKGSKIENIKKKYNREIFIYESNKVHKEKYNYDKLVFSKLGDKSIIICPKHGEFKQRLSEHLNGHGCNKCGKESMSKKLSLSHNEILNRIKEKHGDKYEYIDLEDLSLNKELNIICPKHGEFTQKVVYHLKHGCRDCGYDNFPNMGIETFIEKSNIIHNKFYDYSKFSYVKSNIPSIIICPKHGEFKQTPNTHLSGSGCMECGYEKNGVRLNSEDFFNKCKEIHNNKYKYDENSYTTTRNNIIIFCEKHGRFDQNASAHLYAGCGCPRCRESVGESKIRAHLENNNINFEQEKSFDNCFYKGKLLFDFYLPDYNLCVEFDGIQHFKPMEFFGGVDGYTDTTKRDSIKNKFCEDNNIKLLRISYKDIKKINKILSEFLK